MLLLLSIPLSIPLLLVITATYLRVKKNMCDIFFIFDLLNAMEFPAHKLALFDLGKAIAINPARADNFVLRGDCHSRMGNYEQVRLNVLSG